MSRIEQVSVFDGTIADAAAQAAERHEPILLPVQVYADDRGWSIMNQFRGVLGPEGQINFSTQYPGIIKAWHRHRRQTDFWMCVRGHMKIGVHREEGDRQWLGVIGEMRPTILIIPPLLWHGSATVGPEPACLLYYVTRAYDPADPDEERRPYDALPGFPWSVLHK